MGKNLELDLTLESDGIKLQQNKAMSYSSFYQKVENFNILTNKTLTLSFLFYVPNGKECVFALKADSHTGGGLITNFKIAKGNNNIAFGTGTGITPASISTYLSAIVYSHNFEVGDYFKVFAAKLEEGPRQTLAHKDADGNWVLNDPPPDKQQELAKCQRYFQNIGIIRGMTASISNGGGYATTFIPISVPFRANPIISSSTNFIIRLKDADIAASSVSINTICSSGIVLSINSDKISSNARETCGIFTENSTLSFSADL